MKKIILTALAVLMVLGLVGCSGVLHDVAKTNSTSIEITFKDGGVLTLTDCGGNGVVVDGSPFSWNEGSPVTLSGEGPVYQITENGKGLPAWCINENPWIGTKNGMVSLGSYPAGCNMAAKLKIGDDEGWVPYNVGGTATYSWNNRK